MTNGAVIGYEGKRSGDKAILSLKEVSRDNVGRYYSWHEDRQNHYGFTLLLSFFRTSFLPVGYPASVRPEYIRYQMYDSLQALCSYLRGVLCVHAVLVGAGVGLESGNALGAALAWVLKDGIGMIGSIIFASTCSSYFFVYMKEWRLFADVINDIGQFLDMLSALVPNHLYLSILSLSAICKAFCGVAAGATKLCITNHLARSHNAGDLATKEGTQETAITLVGLFLGMFSAQYVVHDAFHTMILFIALTFVHIWANYKAVYVLHVETINPSRGNLLVNELYSVFQSIQKSSQRKEMDTEIILGSILGSTLTIAKINALESLSATATALHWNKKIVMGCSLSSALNAIGNDNPFSEASIIQHVKEFESSGCNYILLPRSKSLEFSVLLKPSHKPVDIFQAFVHCRFLQLQAGNAGDMSSLEDIRAALAALNHMWSAVLSELQSEGWDISENGILWNSEGWLYSFSNDKFDTNLSFTKKNI